MAAGDIFHLDQGKQGPLGQKQEVRETFAAPAAQSGTDVTIRTMASDLESIYKSGGGQSAAPVVHFENPAASGTAPKTSGARGAALKIIATLAGVVVLGSAVWYGFGWVRDHSSQLFNSANKNAAPAAQQSENTPSKTPAGLLKTSPVVSAPVIESDFIHTSLLRSPADQVFQYPISRGAQTAADLQTYSQKVSQALGELKSNAALIEIQPIKKQAAAASFGDFLFDIQSNLIDQEVLAQNFNPDFTFFIYRNRNEYWPGFVLQLKSGKNWLYLKDEISRIEYATARDVIFLSPAGTPSKEGFRDDAVGDLSARSLRYSNSSATFMYGWFRNFLIISTSREGMQEVLNRL